MTFKKTEKEIITAIVKYGEKDNSMAKVLNKSQLLEKKGIVIAFASGRNYVFRDKKSGSETRHHVRVLFRSPLCHQHLS